jgi:anti-sigma factor RsiW
MSCNGISCQELCEFLTHYMEGELPPAKRASFDGHLQECPPCRAYMHQLQEIVRLSKQCLCTGPKPPPPPEDLVKAVLSAIAADPKCPKKQCNERHQ